MKKISLLIPFLLIFIFSKAQTPQVPSGTPGQRQLPVPKIRPLPPADLIVSGITFVSIVHNPDTKMYVIRAIVTTRNIGELRSDKTQVSAYTKTPVGSGSWTLVSVGGNVAYIDPGKTYSAVYTFTGSSLTIGGVPFDFRVKTDAGNFVSESDESNNFSATIVINPRAH